MCLDYILFLYINNYYYLALSAIIIISSKRLAMALMGSFHAKKAVGQL